MWSNIPCTLNKAVTYHLLHQFQFNIYKLYLNREQSSQENLSKLIPEISSEDSYKQKADIQSSLRIFKAHFSCINNVVINLLHSLTNMRIGRGVGHKIAEIRPINSHWTNLCNFITKSKIVHFCDYYFNQRFITGQLKTWSFTTMRMHVCIHLFR